MGLDGNLREPRMSETTAAERGLLDSVLQWTEATLAADDPLEAADVEGLREVARRHRGEPVSLKPAAVELVEAMLQTQFRVHAEWLPVWRNASEWIAESLWEDPASRSRLEGLWGRLTGDAQPRGPNG
jgi:hypothetical protein